jgi:SSS family solute:Na+ symporter
MSSGDAIAHASASIAVRDGLVTGLGLRLQPESERRLIRILLVAVLVASFVVSGWFGESIVRLLLFAYGPVTQLAPAIVATLYWRRATAWGVVAGLAAGITVNLALALHADWRPWPLHAGLYGLFANGLALWLVSRLTRPRLAQADAFLRTAADPSAGSRAGPA